MLTGVDDSLSVGDLGGSTDIGRTHCDLPVGLLSDRRIGDSAGIIVGVQSAQVQLSPGSGELEGKEAARNGALGV